jgi:hypothetical protein
MLINLILKTEGALAYILGRTVFIEHFNWKVTVQAEYS